MIQTFERSHSYIGKCDKCKQDLSDFIGVLRGPDREDDTEWYDYDLCKNCLEDYNRRLDPLIKQFTIGYLSIPPSNYNVSNSFHLGDIWLSKDTRMMYVYDHINGDTTRPPRWIYVGVKE